jgi:hypothetical protein
MGELKRAVEQLGVTGTVLRRHGWRTVSRELVEAVKEDPREWLTAARERRREKRTVRRRARERRRIAGRLDIQARAVNEHEVTPDRVEQLLAAAPEWLIAERARRQEERVREAKDGLGRDLAEALACSVREVWFEELKRAAGDAEADAIDVRWAGEIKRARRAARGLVDVLTEEQVRARIGREEAAMNAAAVYRAQRLARRAFGSERG